MADKFPTTHHLGSLDGATVICRCGRCDEFEEKRPPRLSDVERGHRRGWLRPWLLGQQDDGERGGGDG